MKAARNRDAAKEAAFATATAQAISAVLSVKGANNFNTYLNGLRKA